MFYISKYFHDGHEHHGGNNNGGHNHGEHPCCDDCFIYINGMRFNIEKGITINMKDTEIVIRHLHPSEDIQVQTIEHTGYSIKIETPAGNHAGNEHDQKLFINAFKIPFKFSQQQGVYIHPNLFASFSSLEELAKAHIKQYPGIVVDFHEH